MVEPNSHGDITELLQASQRGDSDAAQQLWLALHSELRAMAERQLASEDAGLAMQPTALVHETYLRLFGNEPVPWASRRQFFAACGKVMRRIRVDDARTRKRLKRGGGQRPSQLQEDAAAFDGDPAELLAVHEALDRLQENAPQRAEIVALRYFAGLTEQETAAALGLSRRTVQLEWKVARAWLHRELSKGDTTLPRPMA